MNASSDPDYDRYADLDFEDAKPASDIPALAQLQAEHGGKTRITIRVDNKSQGSGLALQKPGVRSRIVAFRILGKLEFPALPGGGTRGAGVTTGGIFEGFAQIRPSPYQNSRPQVHGPGQLLEPGNFSLLCLNDTDFYSRWFRRCLWQRSSVVVALSSQR